MTEQVDGTEAAKTGQEIQDNKDRMEESSRQDTYKWIDRQEYSHGNIQELGDEIAKKPGEEDE